MKTSSQNTEHMRYPEDYNTLTTERQIAIEKRAEQLMDDIFEAYNTFERMYWTGPSNPVLKEEAKKAMRRLVVRMVKVHDEYCKHSPIKNDSYPSAVLMLRNVKRN